MRWNVVSQIPVTQKVVRFLEGLDNVISCQRQRGENLERQWGNLGIYIPPRGTSMGEVRGRKVKPGAL